MNTEKVTRRKHELAAAIVGRMTVEHAADLSDAEIERTLAACVGGSRLIRLAKELRDEGLLSCRCDPQPQMACCPTCDKTRPQFGNF
jgi:hypothetical protein